MDKKDFIQIDDRQLAIQSGSHTPSELLQLAGKSGDDISLVLADGNECPDPNEPIDVVSGDQFTTRKNNQSLRTPTKNLVCYSVNGEPATTDKNPLTLEEVLSNAGPGAAIDTNDLGSYYLESLSDGQRYDSLDCPVKINEGDNFLAIHVGRTPVADSGSHTVNKIIEELQNLGFEPKMINLTSHSNIQRAVMFNYKVETGSYKGNSIKMAISFQEDAYPEYPPHFVHFESKINLKKIPVHSFHHFEGQNWSVYSIPPSDFWDTLSSSEKNMGTYIKRHIQRVLAQQ
ncbi:MAG: hypothetical protein OXF06_02115 [Bacteroidetes bacterium]|nr:hypothetical protein [Bacteroidota bacterium]MCY4223607.1 hypothetical protein [Bacteroidota bacterium]